MEYFSNIAQNDGIYIDTCAEEYDLSSLNIKHACCIDKQRLERIGNYKLDIGKDKNQIGVCGCIVSIDIGMYKLPHNLYMRMLYLVRDYDRLKSERDDIINALPAPDGSPHTGVGNPTESKGIKLAELRDGCKAIDDALAIVPKEYRRGVWNNICYQCPYPIDACESTYKR